MTDRTKTCFLRLRDDLVHPPEQATVLEWSERHLYLSPEFTLAEPGKFKCNRMPWLKKPMDDFTKPDVHRQVLCWANQCGKTTFLLGVVGRTIHLNPQPIIWLLPDEDLAKRISKERLQPAIRDCAPLRSRIKEAKSRDSNNTILSKSYPGGTIELPGANSPAGLSMSMAGILLCDEVDIYPPSNTIGDPVALLEKRATTAFNRKIILCSTPTNEVGRIWREWEASSQETWVTPCPKCRALQAMEWDSAAKNPDFETLCYQCTKCHERSFEHEWKRSSTEGGRYLAAFPERSTRGYRVNSLVHPFLSWSELFREFYAANARLKEKDYGAMKSFRNGRLALIWESRANGETTDPEVFWTNHREPYTGIPDDVVCLTIGGDTQKDVVYIELCGWTALSGCRAISYQTFGPGDPSQSEFWKPILAFAAQEFQRNDGKKLKVSFGCVDAGGLFSDAVKNILGFGSVLKPIFGRRESISKEVITRSDDGRYFLVNSHMAKSEVDYRQRTGPEEDHAFRWLWPMGPDGGAASGYDEAYFREYCAQACITKYRNGEKIVTWQPIKEGEPEHAGDVRAYGYAALVWMRKARHNFLERQAQDIEEQVVNRSLIQKPLLTPEEIRRERMIKEFGSSPGSGRSTHGFGTEDESLPWGPLRPKQAEPHPEGQGYGYR
jgi:phage terminase large subunit GpA-like protein